MPANYSNQNLRGRSFKGQNLEGADFSGADIRGADFTGAKLRGASFKNAKTGLQKRWVTILVLVSWVLAGISGFFSAYASVFVALIFDGNTLENQITGWVALVVIIVFFAVTIRQGINTAFVGALVLAGTGALVLVGAFAGAGAGVLAFIFAGAFAGALSFIFAGVFAGAFAGALSFIFGGAVAGAFIFAVAGALVGAVAGSFVSDISFNFAYDITGAFAKKTSTSAFLAAFAFAIALIFSLLSIYIAHQALKGEEKYTIIRTTAVAFAAFGGTSFRNADLTDADFTQASLKSTDFRKANLTRTCFHQVKKLDRVRPGTSYLQYANLRKVLTTGQGQSNNFDRFDLRGVNFQKAYLSDASFIAADVSNASFQDTDLSRAKLIQAQLDGTNFTGATLTGAYIEDWNITHETNFTGVRCEYVYMRSPTKLNPDPLRKPDNREEVFKDGDFADFIQPIFDTLDLYHNQGVDPRAIAISFKQLAENHPDAELGIVAMEKRGEDKFLLRARTAPQADKSELSAEYFDTYNQIKALPEREIKLLLAEKDSQISDLRTMVMTALQNPKYYSNTQVGQVSTMTNNPGGFSVGGSVGGDVKNLQGDNNRTVQGDNNQGVLGDNNQVTQQNQVGTDTDTPLTKDDVIKLLAQLEALVKDTDLPAETKEEVVEDLDSAKKATDKEEPNKNLALKRLGSVADTLEKTSKTVESGQKIWTTAKPIIVKVASWLGAAAGSHLLGL